MLHLRMHLAVVATTLLVSCGGSSGGEVIVFAASSLTDAFTALGAEFEKANPGIDLVFNFAGSSTLAAQIEEGAPADVFAAAGPDPMERVVVASDAPSVARFATNRLVIAVERGNPLGIDGLSDLAAPGVLVSLCASEVPCGSLADAAFQAAGLDPPPADRAPNVRSVLTRVRLGEVDAGIVYATDLPAASEVVDGIELPDTVASTYLIAVLPSGTDPSGGGRFVAFVLGPAGQRILASYGFGSTE